MTIPTRCVREDKLSIMWDAPWQPIRDSAALQRYWRDDLSPVKRCSGTCSRSLGKNNVKDIGLGFDCRVLYQRPRSAPSTSIPPASA